MEQVTFIQYYFHNPILCFFFCYCILNAIVWIEKNYEWIEYLIISTVLSALYILFSFIWTGKIYYEDKTEIVIYPVNSAVSNTILIITLLTLVIYALLKAFVHWSKKRSEMNLSLILIESLKSDFLTLQNHIYKLESTSEPYSNRKILEFQFELNDVKTALDGIEFQKDRHKEIKKTKNKIDELKHKLLLQ